MEFVKKKKAARFICRRDEKSMSLQIFGGFIASELLERHNNQFFGTGETFLFSLSPDVEHYTWTAEADLILRANDHELIIGSGGG